MNRIKLARPSPALVISIVAMFAALGGGAFAATATTSKKALDNKGNLQKNVVKKKNIAKNAVVTKKIKDGKVTGSKLSDESVSASKLGTIVERSAQVNVPANNRAATTAVCLDGETVISGGGQLDGPNSAIYTSQREGNGWQGNARNNNPGPRLFTVKVYCLQ